MSYQRSSALDATQEDVKPKFKEGQFVYPEEDQEKIQERLNIYLTKEDICSRAAFNGSKVSYIEGWRTFQIANEIFGFNGWSTSILNTSVDYLDVIDGRFSVGISSLVRVTLKDGSYHEDIGYGMMENSKSKGAAFEKAKKESVTDAVKRALRYFGNSLGNCLYDKGFLKASSKASAAPLVGFGVNSSPLGVNGFGNATNSGPRAPATGFPSNTNNMRNSSCPDPSTSLVRSSSHGTYPSSNERLSQITSNPQSRAQMGNQGPTNGPGVQTRNLGSNHGQGIHMGSSGSSCGPGVQLGNSGSNHGPGLQMGSSGPNHRPGIQMGSSGSNHDSSNRLDSRNSGAKSISTEKASVREDSFDFDFHDESFSQIDPNELVHPNPGPSGNTHLNQNAPPACTAFGLDQRGVNSTGSHNAASIQMSTAFTSAAKLATTNSSSSSGPPSQHSRNTPTESQPYSNMPDLKRQRGF